MYINTVIYFYFSGAEAKKTWKMLIQQFKLHFEELPLPKSGDPTPEDSVDWPYFISLLFSKDIFEKRPVTGNLPDVPDIEELEKLLTAKMMKHTFMWKIPPHPIIANIKLALVH